MLPTALILAGGLGTRLRSVFSSGPKCMVPVSGRPFLEYMIEWLTRAGVYRINICVGYKRSHIQKWFGRGRQWGADISYTVEQSPLGTGGALRNARQIVSGDRVFVLNGDTFVDVDLRKLLEFDERSQGMGSIALAHVADASRYGTVDVGEDSRIVRFKEKAAINDENIPQQHRALINAGVYVLQRTVLDRIPEGPVSLEKTVFPDLLEAGLYGFQDTGYFIDIGIPEDLQRASEIPRRFGR